jgi:hypothetical protein
MLLVGLNSFSIVFPSKVPSHFVPDVLVKAGDDFNVKADTSPNEASKQIEVEKSFIISISVQSQLFDGEFERI